MVKTLAHPDRACKQNCYINAQDPILKQEIVILGIYYESKFISILRESNLKEVYNSRNIICKLQCKLLAKTTINQLSPQMGLRLH